MKASFFHRGIAMDRGGLCARARESTRTRESTRNCRDVSRDGKWAYCTVTCSQNTFVLAKLAEKFTCVPWTQHAAGHIYLLGVFNRGPARRTIAHAVAAPGANAQPPVWSRFLYVRARRLSGAAQCWPRVPRGVEAEAAQAMLVGRAMQAVRRQPRLSRRQGVAACRIS